MNSPANPERPWAVLYTKAAKTHVFARYTSRPDAETAAQQLRRIMPDGTLEVCWDVNPKG